MIHQELSLLPDRTVAQNVLLGQEPRRGSRLDRAAMRGRAARLMARLRSRIDPDARAGALSVAEQQVVEIAKELASAPNGETQMNVLAPISLDPPIPPRVGPAASCFGLTTVASQAPG